MFFIQHFIYQHLFVMKTNTTGRQKGTDSNQENFPKHPLNKNKIDSREGEEQLTKGGSTTHNKKEKHGEQKKK
jgi:hypothetical protein